MTSRFIYDRHAELVTWAEARTGFRFREDVTAIGHMRQGELKAVALADTWSTTNAFTHIVSDGSRRWFSREFAIRWLAYLFVQAKLRRISCIIAESNDDSLRFTRRFGGWVEEGRLRKAAPDGSDIILFGMLREDAPYLPAAALFQPGPRPSLQDIMDRARRNTIIGG